MRIESEASQVSAGGSKYKLFWGDLHNHNAVGYAKGSLQRSIEIAREHLDFFAFTGHASWHDMPKMPGDRHLKWVNGFKARADHWPKTRRLIREANDRDFVAFLGYEWHSSRFGDYCMVFEQDQPELFLPDHVEKLLDFAEAKGALAIPHHVAYKEGWRGANFDHFRPKSSPVVEVFSEHGCSEDTAAPFPYIRHSMSGRSTANTIERQLEKGLRFGFVASSDSHRGYPGAYGEGVTGVWARELTAEALFEALRARRTCAATGDRIILDVTLNGRPMGSGLAPVADRQIDVRAEGQDSIEMIELIRNGQVIERWFPMDSGRRLPKLPGRVKCRFQYGWGPWAALDLGRICSWDMAIRVNAGKFLQVIPCFQSAPFAEDLRDTLQVISPREIHIRSHTSRERCFAEDPTKAVVVEIEGSPNTKLTIQFDRPTQQVVSARLIDLLRDNLITFTGVFTSESHIVHRLVGPDAYSATVRFHDRRDTARSPDWYYVRLRQHNGHMAWSSPIWIG
jgi:hypothetical protein